MPEVMLPQTFVVPLASFAGASRCLVPRTAARSWRVGSTVSVGGTITDVALASGAIGSRHISVFHRCFSRAKWALA